MELRNLAHLSGWETGQFEYYLEEIAKKLDKDDNTGIREEIKPVGGVNNDPDSGIKLFFYAVLSMIIIIFVFRIRFVESLITKRN